MRTIKRHEEKQDSFGDCVRYFRIGKRITLRALCGMTGIEPSRYSRIERGIEAPSEGMADLISEKLGLSKDDREHLSKLAKLEVLKDGNANAPAFVEYPDGRKPTEEDLRKMKEFLGN